MSLNAVQSHVQALLDGLPNPYYPDVQAWVQPPLPGLVEQPQVYVWGGTGVLDRQAAPRFTGTQQLGAFKRWTWTVDVWILMDDIVDSDVIDQAFPCLIDVIVTALCRDTMPVTITDPTTNAVSQLVEIGERIQMDYAPVHSVEQEQMVQQNALLRCTLVEVFQG